MRNQKNCNQIDRTRPSGRRWTGAVLLAVTLGLIFSAGARRMQAESLPGGQAPVTGATERDTADQENAEEAGGGTEENSVAPLTIAGAGTESASQSAAEEGHTDRKERTSARERADLQAASWLSSMVKSVNNTQPVSLKIPVDSSRESSLQSVSEVGAEALATITANQKISRTDYQTLLNIVEAECTGGDEHSKLLVANVILNRVKDSHFPDSVTEVVWQRTGGGAQFSPTADGRMGSLAISDTTKSAVDRAISGEDISEGALFFIAKSSAAKTNVSWFEQNLQYLYSYGGHDFYKF